MRHFRINSNWIRPILGLSCFFCWMITMFCKSYVYEIYLNENHIKIISGLDLYTIAAFFIGLFLVRFFVYSSVQAKKIIQFNFSLCLCYSFLFIFEHSIVHDYLSILIALAAGSATACCGYFVKIFVPDKASVKPLGLFLCTSMTTLFIIGLVATICNSKVGIFLTFLVLTVALYEASRLPVDEEVFHRGSAKIVKDKSFYSTLLILFFVLLINIHSSYFFTVIDTHFSEYQTYFNCFWIFSYLLLVNIVMIFGRLFRPQQSINYMFIGLALAYILYDCLPHTLWTYIILSCICMAIHGLADIMSLVSFRHLLNLSPWPIHLTAFFIIISCTGRVLAYYSGKILLKIKVVQDNFTNISVLFILLCIGIFSFWLQKIIDNSPFQDSDPKPEVPADIKKEKPSLYKLLSPILSERETQVAMMIIDGKTQKEIAEAISLSENTIKFHTKNIYAKLNIHSKQELKTYCRQLIG